MITNAYVLIRVLRDVLDCNLPVEIWYFGSHEFPGFLSKKFVALGCFLVDARTIPNDNMQRSQQTMSGWQLKAQALKFTSFENVILLDADQVPVRDPEEIFNWPEYREFGAVFWPDVVDISNDNPVWKLLGLTQMTRVSWESGQLCINRKRHWLSVCLVDAMNQDRETFYSMVYGDKDTFLLSWLLTGASFALIPHKPFADEFYLCQRDFAGRSLFQHRTNCKWSLFGDNIRPDGFKLFSECEVFLQDLYAIWNGRTFDAPTRLPAMYRDELELVRQRYFTLAAGSARSTEIELLDGNQIGKGRSFQIMNWCVREFTGCTTLVLYDSEKPVAALERKNENTWQGKTLGKPILPVVLHAIEPDPSCDRIVQRQSGLVADLIFATWNGGHGNASDHQLLDAALTMLARIDLQVAMEVADMAVLIKAEDKDLHQHLLDLACRLETSVDTSLSASTEHLLQDTRYYVRT